MADSITTNQDLIDYKVLSRADIVQLTDIDNRYDEWEDEHQRAWSEVLSYLYRTRQIEESDLTNTSQLKLAVCDWVAYLVLRGSKFQDRKSEAQNHRNLAIKELSEILLESNGVELPANPIFGTARVIRG